MLGRGRSLCRAPLPRVKALQRGAESGALAACWCKCSTASSCRSLVAAATLSPETTACVMSTSVPSAVTLGGESSSISECRSVPRRSRSCSSPWSRTVTSSSPLVQPIAIRRPPALGPSQGTSASSLPDEVKMRKGGACAAPTSFTRAAS
eukprot:15442-Heterococcus_DN1.PRE.4